MDVPLKTSFERPYRFPARRVFDNPGFPLAVTICRDHLPLEYHLHEDFTELVIVLKGKALHHCSQHNYQIGAGDIFLIPEGMVHAYSECDDFEVCNLLFNREKLQLPEFDLAQSAAYHVLFNLDPFNQRRDRFENRVRASGKDLPELLRMALEFHHLQSSDRQGKHFSCVGKFIEIISYIIQIYEKNIGKDSGNENIPQRLGLLASRLENSSGKMLSVEEMCHVTNMSRATLFRQFKRCYYDTPYVYQLNLRLNCAARLLIADLSMSVAAVGMNTGFTDSNYFARSFRRYYGVSPREYRRLYSQTDPVKGGN